jgi:RNA polymerase sigma-70 factor (ECF subfamily)
MTAALSEMDSTADVELAADRVAFSTLVARHRGELYVHCLRILRSPEQAEDALQEALLRAWRSRSGYAGRSTVRAWLYRIATNTCLDEIRRDRGRTRRHPAVRVVPLDDEAVLPAGATASDDPGPDVLVEAAETLERAFLTAIDLLPPRQRAVLVLCEALRCPAVEVAALLGTSVAAVNSALQRARTTLAGDGPSRSGGRPARVRPGAADRVLLGRYVDALRRHDVAAVVALARADGAGASAGPAAA